MDWYSIVKFAHIVSAIIWVGGGFTLMLLAVLAERANNQDSMMFIMKTVAQIGNKLFAPMSMLTLVFGLVMSSFWIGFSDLWIIIGLAGFAAAMLTGMLVLKPAAERMLAIVEKEGFSSSAISLARRMLAIGKIDYAVMFVVIADMVMKPTLDDVATLAVMAAILATGVALAFTGLRHATPAHA